jgi:hypothetical protein
MCLSLCCWYHTMLARHAASNYGSIGREGVGVRQTRRSFSGPCSQIVLLSRRPHVNATHVTSTSTAAGPSTRSTCYGGTGSMVCMLTALQRDA